MHCSIVYVVVNALSADLLKVEDAVAANTTAIEPPPRRSDDGVPCQPASPAEKCPPIQGKSWNSKVFH